MFPELAGGDHCKYSQPILQYGKLPGAARDVVDQEYEIELAFKIMNVRQDGAGAYQICFS